MDMNEIKEIFFQECEEQLAELESGLLKLNDGDRDPETVNAVFRAVHSIKGGAGAFGLDDLVAFAHVFETTLDCVRSNKLEPTQDVLKVMLRSADVLADLTNAARDGGSVDESRTRGLVKELEALANGEAVPASAPAPVAVKAPEPVKAKPTDESGFEPIPFSFTDFADETTPLMEAPSFQITFKPHASLYSKGNEAALLLRDLSRIGEMSINCDMSELPSLDKLDPEASYLSWTVSITTDKGEEGIRSVFEFAEWDCDLEITPVLSEAAAGEEELPMIPVPFDLSALDSGAEEQPVVEVATAEASYVAAAVETAVATTQIAQSVNAAIEKREAAAAPAAAQANANAAANASAGQTIRVDLDRVDRLINLVGELVINQAMLSQSVIENDASGTSAVNMGLDELQQLTREIQDSVMAIRAQPVKPVFQRMSRIVREVADMIGKQIRLVTEGENTEVDKTVIDKLAEPLTHMIRNAVDHGIETPEKRDAGKNPEGTIKLSAKHRSGRILIELQDDGAGINRERVRQKAIDNDLIAADANLTDEEIDNLIFAPGFSTADKISDISGRGVGMDVVKRSIQALGGRINISSRPGQGSTFTMSLPLTLAVLDGMVVTVAGQTLVVPLTAIVETLQPEAKNIHSFGANQRLISIRNSFCPLVDVGRVLNFRPTQADPVEGVALLVESEGGGQRALMVDAIQGQRQVVIKSLEANYTHVPGIAAATILGDGRVALILDVDAIVSASRGQPLKQEMSLAAAG